MTEFLKLLETEGGKVLVILFMLIFIIGIAVLLVLTGHPPQEVGKELMTGAISSLLTLLYSYLSKGGKQESK